MHIRDYEKPILFKDFDSIIPQVQTFINYKAGIDDINSFEKELGVDIDMTKEQIASAVFRATVDNVFMEINDYSGSIFATFENFFKTEDLNITKVEEFEYNLFLHFDDIVHLWNDFYDSTLAIVPEYAALHTDEILNSCDITKEYCSLKARND